MNGLFGHGCKERLKKNNCKDGRAQATRDSPLSRHYRKTPLPDQFFRFCEQIFGLNLNNQYNVVRT